MKIVLVTGGFDPLHSGHIEYFKAAKELADELWVGLNSDEWLTNKKGCQFMPMSERSTIIESLEVVDRVLSFNDFDGSANGAIIKAFNVGAKEIIFANGGDRTKDNIPEMWGWDDNPNGEFMFGVGGKNKKNSSSGILEEWKTPKTTRAWGWYRVLDDKPGVKVKELVIAPGKSLSNQRHFKRAEHWYVLKGKVHIKTETNYLDPFDRVTTLCKDINLAEHNTHVIKENVWHKATNLTKEHCHILEVQYGDECAEEDIERKP